MPRAIKGRNYHFGLNCCASNNEEYGNNNTCPMVQRDTIEGEVSHKFVCLFDCFFFFNIWKKKYLTCYVINKNGNSGVKERGLHLHVKSRAQENHCPVHIIIGEPFRSTGLFPIFIFWTRQGELNSWWNSIVSFPTKQRRQWDLVHLTATYLAAGTLTRLKIQVLLSIIVSGLN